MSTVVVSSCAYLGDVAPFLSVGRRLVAEGHEVTMLAPAGYEPMVAGEGFRYAAYGLDMSAATMHADPEHSKLMRHPIRNMPRLGPYWMARSYLDDPEACEQSVRDALADADCLVTHPTMGMVTIPIATSMGVPTVVGHLFPMVLPTAMWNPPMPSVAETLTARGSRASRRSRNSPGGGPNRASDPSEDAVPSPKVHRVVSRDIGD